MGLSKFIKIKTLSAEHLYDPEISALTIKKLVIKGLIHT
jgi:hypothetical protein